MPPRQPLSFDELRLFLADFHSNGRLVDDELVDTMMGLNRAPCERLLSLGTLLITFGQHRMQLGDLGYAVIRDLYHALAPSREDVILDLGSGYGRIGIYGGVLFGQRVVGIEIVPERVAEAMRVRNALGLNTVSFLQGDILTAAWPEASIYLLLNTDFPPTMPALIARLHQLSKSRSLLIASLSSSNASLRLQPWLREHTPNCPSAKLPVELRLFRSHVPHSSATETMLA
jgi:SAM-dependent methyltransferase